jgi:DNA-binding GntR family transcriptional regulator
MSTASDLPSLYRADSLAEQAYRAIREGIATGLFRAGERVTERGLAARLNVSATPVREALRRLEQEGLIERVSARQLRVVDHSAGTLRELMLTFAALRALEARFATHKITDAALDRMAALVEAQASREGIDIPERLRIAREFDMEIERAAANPTLRSMILSLSIIGQERRARSVESLLQHPEAGLRRVQDHRDLLAAFRERDPDLVEQVFRRHAATGVELLLGDLDLARRCRLLARVSSLAWPRDTRTRRQCPGWPRDRRGLPVLTSAGPASDMRPRTPIPALCPSRPSTTSQGNPKARSSLSYCRRSGRQQRLRCRPGGRASTRCCSRAPGPARIR